MVKVIMSRAKRGLYAGRHIQFGNKVSEDGGNKSRRTWKPNVQSKRILSLALDHYIQINLTTHALRCIDKGGGLDEYLLKIPYRKLENDNALFWKHKIAFVYDMLANTEIAIPVQNPADGSFSLEVYADPFPSNEKQSKEKGNPEVDASRGWSRSFLFRAYESHNCMSNSVRKVMIKGSEL